ncbi:MAG: insulinase family protein [Planctomycetes bacterium]|nr:insulinase family protein [Planctomycetota bacterium]
MLPALCLLAASLLAPAALQDLGAAPPPVARPLPDFRMPDLVEETLENGLHVVVCARPGQGLVDVRLALRAGAWLEGEWAGTGISHYFEHLVAGGSTRARTEEESKQLVRALGGMKSATTDADRTWVYITTVPEGLERALDLLADWVANLALPEAEVAREKEVILRELELYADQDPRRVWELLHATAFRSHPARLPLQGCRERFAALAREDLVQFHERCYVPANAVLAVVGDVDPARASRLARAAFSAWRAGRLPEPYLPAEPAQHGRRFARLPGVGTRASVALGWRTVALDHEDMILLDTLQAITGSGSDSRLWRRVVDGEGLAGSLRVLSRTPALGGGLFAVLADAAPEQVARLEEVVQEELLRIAEQGVEDAEVERAALKMYAEVVFGLESVEELAQTLTRDYLQTGDCRYTETYLELLRAVTPERVQAAAARYLRPERLTVAVVGPPGAGGGAEAVAGGEEARAGMPPARAAAETLGNGVRLRLLPEPGCGVVAIHAALAGGSLLEDAATAGAASILADLLLRGGRQDLAERLKRLEARGGSASCSADRFALGLAVQALKEDAVEALDFVAGALGNVSVAAEAFAPARKRALARAAARRTRFDTDAEDCLFGRVFPGSPLGLRLGGAEEALAALEAAAVEDLAQRMLWAGNLVVAVAGDFDPAEVRARLALLELPQEGGQPEVKAPPPAIDPAGETVFLDTERSQVSVILAFPGASVAEEEERAALDLVDAWASGRRIASGPLYDALRGARDLVYFVQAEHRPMPGAGLFYVLAQCAPERYAEVVETLRAEVTALGRGAMNEADLALARNVLLVSRQTAHQTQAARAYVAAAGGVYGLPADAEERYRERVQSVALERVNEAARRTFQGDGLLLVLWPKEVPKP